jgi:IS1 family transposase
MTSETAVQHWLKPCGSRYLPSIANALYSERDFWSAYELVFPSKRHRAVGKETGKTGYIERFNCTLRQRMSRLVRKTLSFSKNLDNHIGAIWNFIHYYNASFPLATSFPL